MLRRATLQIRTGTPKLTIGMANLGVTGSLVRVSTPSGSPAAQLQVTGGAGTGGSALVSVSAKDAASVTVTLNTAVGWRLELASGTKQTIADLRHGQVSGVAITAGSAVLDLLLPAPRGSVPIRLAAGASQFLLSVPHGSAVRVTAAKGAGQVSLEGSQARRGAQRLGVHHARLGGGDGGVRHRRDRRRRAAHRDGTSQLDVVSGIRHLPASGRPGGADCPSA